MNENKVEEKVVERLFPIDDLIDILLFLERSAAKVLTKEQLNALFDTFADTVVERDSENGAALVGIINEERLDLMAQMNEELANEK